MQLTLTAILSGKVGQIKIWCLFGVYWGALASKFAAHH